ncbi:cryptochrome [Hyaloscypha variabilis]
MNSKDTLIYLLRRDLRVADNPILHSLSTQQDHSFTHMLPLYVFNAQQLEVSGFLQEGETSPYKEARSQVAGFWRCGPHRAKFLAESVWDVKEGLEKIGSGLCIRVGSTSDVIRQLIPHLSGKAGLNVKAIWMVGEDGVEESREERAIRDICTEADLDFKLWNDEKYLIDDRDLPFNNIQELSDVFTTYRKTVEPLRDHPRAVLPSPEKGSLPGYPPVATITPQFEPFQVPDTFAGLLHALMKPLNVQDLVPEPLQYPEDAKSAHPFDGGERPAYQRLLYIISSGAATNYHSTRNGLLGEDFSTKLSAYLALGSITARQIHEKLVAFEDGTDNTFESAAGYGNGENEGTKAIRFELLWRDYMHLCNRKFGPRLFSLGGFKSDDEQRWTSPSNAGDKTSEVRSTITRFTNGTTGMGLIDASLRELIHTGYTSNRARQNVASFLAKHLHIDWRIGAEWYESMLVDYDLSSNWGNWQYLAGVGNDPRGPTRIFNPVKQAFDYDPQGAYVKTWIPELRGVTEPSEIFQAWTMSDAKKSERGLKGKDWVEDPLLKIDFTVGRRGRNPGRGGRGGDNRRGGGGGGENRGGRGGGGDVNRGQPRGGGYGGRGYGNTRGVARGYGRGRGDGGGRDLRMGMMDRERGAYEQYVAAQWN